MKKALVLIFLFISLIGNASIDSLRKVISSNLDNKKKVNAHLWLITAYSNYDSAAFYYDRFERSVEAKSEPEDFAYICYRFAQITAVSGKFEKAIEISQKGVEMAKLKNNDSLIAMNYSRMAFYQHAISDFENSVKSNFKAIEYAEKKGNKAIIAGSYNTLGLTFAEKSPPDYNKSLEYYLISEKMLRQLNNQRNIGLALLRIGDVYTRMENYVQAEKYLSEALEVGEKSNLPLITKWTLDQYGALYKKTGDLQKALKVTHQAMDMAMKEKEFIGVATTATSLAELYQKTGDHKKAILYADSALQIAKRNNLKTLQQISSKTKAEALESMGDYKTSLYYYKQHMSILDSISKKENMNNLNELEKKYMTQKKENELIEKEKELTIQKITNEKQQTQRNYFVGGIVLLIIFSAIMIRGYRKKQKTNELIELQKSEVEHQKRMLEVKQKEITDSIQYAKRIQQAQMPTEKMVEKHLNRLFRKKKYMKRLFILIIFLISHNALLKANNDSLLTIWNNKSKSDSVRLHALFRFAYNASVSNPDTTLKYSEIGIEHSRKIKSLYFLSRFYNNKGSALLYKGNLEGSLNNFFKAIELLDSIGANTAHIYANIGSIYYMNKDLNKAVEYYNSAVLNFQAKDIVSKASILNNLGAAYNDLKLYDKALNALKEACAIRYQLKDTVNMAITYTQIFNVYRNIKQIDSCKKYVNRAYEILKNSDNIYGILFVNINYGHLYSDLKEFKRSNQYFYEALNIAQKIKHTDVILDIYEGLTGNFEKSGKLDSAYFTFKKFTALRDTFRNAEASKKILKQQMSFEFEKEKALNEKEHQAKILIEQEKQEKQKILIFFSIAGAVLLALGLIFLFNRFKITQKQKNIIASQKHLVEEKNKEITDSILYAKRLQRAHLPSEGMIARNLDRLKKKK